MKQNYFFKINNSLITEGNEKHLNVKELYLYSFLLKEKNILNTFKTTVSLLNEFMKIKFAGRKDRNIKEIKETLLSLANKGLLFIGNEDGMITDNFNSNSSLEIKFLELNEGGFVQVFFKEFDRFFSVWDYYIYVAVAKWKKKEFAVYSYERWANILLVSEATAKKVVNSAVEREIIYKNIGDYREGQTRQYINEYSLDPISYDRKTFMTKRQETIQSNKRFRMDNEDMKTFSDISYRTEIFNTYEDENGNSIFPDFSDYLFYLEIKYMYQEKKVTSTVNKFIIAAEKRMENLKDNLEFKEEFQQAENAFQYKLTKMEREEELKESRKNIIDDVRNYF